MKNERLMSEYKDAIASTIKDIQKVLSDLPFEYIVSEHAVTQYQGLNQTSRKLCIKFPNGSIQVQLDTPLNEEAI